MYFTATAAPLLGSRLGEHVMIRGERGEVDNHELCEGSNLPMSIIVSIVSFIIRANPQHSVTAVSQRPVPSPGRSFQKRRPTLARAFLRAYPTTEWRLRSSTPRPAPGEIPAAAVPRTARQKVLRPGPPQFYDGAAGNSVMSGRQNTRDPPAPLTSMMVLHCLRLPYVTDVTSDN